MQGRLVGLEDTSSKLESRQPDRIRKKDMHAKSGPRHGFFGGSGRVEGWLEGGQG
eukprot:CAMPEP_0194756008 /NCGR_PEP_ID=MMETSP0323_2-20130528/9782_1 /TAXON_ID=2866 ORGANISM="Crypthecodinium cohnii, Strain Seligo" /NCGR_SAMPLE_ID=MMETSP0323_2 /ASSEMBLY_ACC=CAM_ASM_000346 /LENGTH=54 /DNA_ID=CAMNT_0039675329 /DNA_START=71 /DNA_END=235 /DNA_ORIENTATION=-